MDCCDDEFKLEYKYFKRKIPKPDLSKVINFDSLNSHSGIEHLTQQCSSSSSEKCNDCENLGLRCHSTWEVYTLSGKKGFAFVKNPFTKYGQQMWCEKALKCYTKKPSITNLDSEYLNINDIWCLQWSNVPDERKYFSKLRWATFGYHHDWNTKVYSNSKMCTFPPCMKSLSKHVALCLGYKNYSPEAAIINFYHLDSSLGGHVDYSEVDYTAPIISFSFGQTAVFLLGGTLKSHKPLAMFLRSGDIVVMGDQCRLAYHAMPLIVKEDVSERWEDEQCSDDWKPFSEYLDACRININVRQVFPS